METCYYCMAPTLVRGRCKVCGRAPTQPGERGSTVLAPGTKLDGGSVTVGECLGRGGFGVTYVAYDNKYNRRIALKEFMPSRMVNGRENGRVIVQNEYRDAYDHALQSFIREARIINVLQSHPNIVKVFFFMEENDTAYYAMEYLEGQNLSELMKSRSKPMKPREICELLSPVMDALTYTHELKVLHRDISADNIFLSIDPERPNRYIPKLIDFGAAYAAIAHFTQSYELVRKGGYTPIEQQLWGIETQGPWTDEYAMCALVYYLLTGKSPAASLDRFLHQKELPLPSQLGIRIPAELEQLLEEGLAINREERIPDVRTLHHRLCALCGMEPCQYFKKPRGVLVDVTSHLLPEPEPNPTAQDSSPAGSVPLEFAGALMQQSLFLGAGVALAASPLGALYGMLSSIVIDLICCLFRTPGRLNMLLTRLKITDDAGGKPKYSNLACFCILHGIPLLLLGDILFKLTGKPSLLESGLQLRVRQRKAGAASVSLSPSKLSGDEYALADGIVLGRSGEMAQLVISDPLISKRHLLFSLRTDGQWTVCDLGSLNGAVLDKVPLEPNAPVAINPGQMLQLGGHSFVFH